jgi:hypothetical protein
MSKTIKAPWLADAALENLGTRRTGGVRKD